MKYILTIYINDSTKIIIPTEYEKEYDLRKDVSNIGNNGLWNKNDTNDFTFIPVHKIEKIDIKAEL
jgi:hypothetical protein